MANVSFHDAKQAAELLGLQQTEQYIAAFGDRAETNPDSRQAIEAAGALFRHFQSQGSYAVLAQYVGQQQQKLNSVAESRDGLNDLPRSV